MVRRTITIDEKIERAKEVLSMTKAKYDLALDSLENLMQKKEEMKKKELMEALVNSKKALTRV